MQQKSYNLTRAACLRLHTH